MSIRNCGELGINLQKIISRLMANEDLIKLLYYTGADPLSEEILTDEQKKKEVFNELIRLIPMVPPRQDSKSVIAIYIQKGSANANNEFQDITFMIDVITPFSQWIIKDTNLRPFAILGEIQKSLVGKNINGLGTIKCGDFALSDLTDEVSIYTQPFMITEYA